MMRIVLVGSGGRDDGGRKGSWIFLLSITILGWFVGLGLSDGHIPLLGIIY
jgi:hypothetical protein